MEIDGFAVLTGNTGKLFHNRKSMKPDRVVIGLLIMYWSLYRLSRLSRMLKNYCARSEGVKFPLKMLIYNP
jgi:hypothetical protein